MPAGRLLPRRHSVEPFLYPDTVGLLGDYQYLDCAVQHLASLRRREFISVYVWNDTELLWAAGSSWNFYPSAFRGISVFAVRDVFHSLHSLRYGGVFSLRLEQGPRTQLHSVRTAGEGFGRGGGCPCHLPLKSSEILVPAPDGRRGYAGLRSLVLSKDQEQEALYIFALIASTLAFYALVYHRELAV